MKGLKIPPTPRPNYPETGTATSPLHACQLCAPGALQTSKKCAHRK